MSSALVVESPQAKPDASKIIPQDRSLAKRPMRPAYLSNAATLGNVEEPPSCMAKTLIGEHGKPTVCDPLPKKAARSGMHSSWAASWTERKSWKASSWALKRRSSKGAWACAKAWRWQSLKFSRPPVTVTVQLVASLMLCWPSTRLTNWQRALARAPSSSGARHCHISHEIFRVVSRINCGDLSSDASVKISKFDLPVPISIKTRAIEKKAIISTHQDLHTYITVHYITLQHITLHYSKAQHITLHYSTLHYSTLQ